MDHFQLIKEVGRGSYGSAMLAIDLNTHITVVIKRIPVCLVPLCVCCQGSTIMTAFSRQYSWPL
jgi:hypothetical protein